MYEIRVYNSDDLDALDDHVREDVEEKVKEVAQHRNPNSHLQTEKLSSKKDLYKLPIKEQHRAIIGIVKPYLIVFRVKYRGDKDVYSDIGRLEDMYEDIEEEVKTVLA